MRVELEKELQDLSPIFLAELYGNEYKTCMHWGINCSNGWFEPLKRFCIKVQELNACLKDVAIVAKQIKEKFGEICIYWDLEKTDKPLFERDSANREDYEEVIAQFRGYRSELYNEIEITCEFCGKQQYAPLKQTTGWIHCVCDDCYNKRRNV